MNSLDQRRTGRRTRTGLRRTLGTGVAAAALLVGGATAAAASPPPGDGNSCGAFAVGGSNGTTMTTRLYAHACGDSVPYFAGIYLQVQRDGQIIHQQTLNCTQGDPTARATCIQNGLTWTTGDPAGVQHWEWGGEVQYVSPITGGIIDKVQSITTADY